MKDQYLREINYLRISVTDQCNLNCFYCMPDKIEPLKLNEKLSDEEIIKIVKEATKIGINKIRITGGDPLVRIGIYDLIKAISNVEGINEITLSTNGTLLIGNVKKLKASGVKRVNISLDTLDQDKFKQITKSNTSLDYHRLIQELIKEDMKPIKINTVLLKGINDNEIDDFINLADQYDISVRFIELMPIGHLDFDYDQYFISKQEILNRYPRLLFNRKELIAEYFTYPDKKGEIGFISPITHQFCEYCNRLRLTSDGSIKTCLHYNDEISLRNKSKEQILTELKHALNKKEEKHKINENITSTRPMHKIGG